MSNTETSLKARYQNMLIRMRELVPMEDFIFGELFECKRVHSSRIRVPVHTGETQQLRAFIAHHCNPFKTGEDPYKGGLRKSAEVVQDMIEGLSMDMTIKQAIASLPLGGGKAGICLEKGFHYTLQDHARMNKAFVIEFDKVNMLGPRIYSTASDLGTSEFDCDIIAKEYVAVHETELGSKRGVATGKSVEEFGNPARKKATGRGGLIAARKMLSLLGDKESERTIAIDGFGNVGQPCFELALEYGFKPVAVSNIDGGLHNPHGLDVEKVLNYFREHKTFDGYKEADAIANEEILSIQCDILFPASTENRLTARTAGGVRARFVGELANGPTTEEGERILLDNGVIIFPDVLLNAGGVIISWRELNVNKEHDRHLVETSEKETTNKPPLQNIMRFNTEKVFETAVKEHLNMRDAAWHVALSRLVPRLQKKHLLYL